MSNSYYLITFLSSTGPPEKLISFGRYFQFFAIVRIQELNGEKNK
jgi:hypothetical protein